MTSESRKQVAAIADRALASFANQTYDPKKARPLLKLTLGQCKWPVRDDNRGVADLFCGEAVAEEGAVYCPTHRARSRAVP
jgi:hypothetical protein